MKKIFALLILILLLISGCGFRIPNDEWQISLEGIESVFISDHSMNDIEIEEEDYLNLIEAYNNINDISLYELFNDGSPVFGVNAYTIKVNYNDSCLHIGLSDVGYINRWDGENIVYYNVDIFDNFNDVFRNTVNKYNIEMTDLRDIIEEDYIRIEYTNRKDYIIDGNMYINDFFDSIDVNNKVSDNFMRVNEYLLTQINNPKCNDTVEVGKLIFKIINVEDDEILSCYVRKK